MSGADPATGSAEGLKGRGIMAPALPITKETQEEGTFFVGPLEVRDRTVTVRVHGEVDVATAPQLWELLARAIGESPRELVVDLGDVPFIDCSGMAVIARACERVPPEACTVVVRSPNRLARKVLALAGLDRRCTVEEPAHREPEPAAAP
jgi:anti-anti-sigma factor